MVIKIENNRSTSSACIGPRPLRQSRRVDIAPAPESDDAYHLRILREHFERDYVIDSGKREGAMNAGPMISRDDGCATFVLRSRRNPPAFLSFLLPGVERYKYIVRFQNGEVCFRDAYHDANFVGRGRCGGYAGLSSSLTSNSSSEGRRARVSDRHENFSYRLHKVNERIVNDRRRGREEKWLRQGFYWPRRVL